MPTTKDIYSGTQLIPYHFVYGGITLYAKTFQITSTIKHKILIRTSRDHKSRALTPGLSQLATSFISTQT